MPRRKNKPIIGKFFFFVISLFFTFEVFGASAGLPADMGAGEFFEKAKLDLKDHKLSGAQSNIDKAIEIDGSNPQFYLFRAQVEAYKRDVAAVSKDVERAEQYAPQLYQIYAFKAGLLKNAFGRGQSYVLNLNKADLFEQLQGRNVVLPKNVFGMITSEFNAVHGPEGYIEVDFDRDFKETSLKGIPSSGKIVKQIFKMISANKKGVSLSKEVVPGDYEIIAYRLETCLLDVSGKFYRFFYWIKYRRK